MATGKTTKTDRDRRKLRAQAKREEATAVRALVREQVAAIEHLENAAVRPSLEVLLAARKELRDDLLAWLKRIDDPADRFTAHQMRVMLRSIEGTLETLGIRLSTMTEAGGHPRATALDRAMLKGLKDGEAKVGTFAVRNLEREIERLGSIFGKSLTGPQFDVMAVMARGSKLLYRSAVNSSARYAGKVGEDLRFQLAIGVARGETFEQLTQRLRRLGGPTGPVAVRGVLGHVDAVVEDIPEGLFKRYEWWARRIVRTEMMSAYNEHHRNGIDELNAGLERGEPRYLRRSDAAADGRVCPYCRSLDGKYLKKGEAGPPYHPCCRCVELAWREDWPDLRDLAGM